jgi:thiamine biosynthesis lipoprotein
VTARAALLLALALPAACAREPAMGELRGATMGTTYTIKYVAAVNPKVVRRVVEGALHEVNACFSTYDPQSELARLNASRSTEPVAASAPLVAVLGQALEIARNTDGAFDPTVLPLVNLYGFGPDGREPRADEAALARAQERIGYTKVEIIDGRSVRKAQPDVEIDLNAIAPGYGVDEVCRALERVQVASYMVEIGGEVRCRGRKPDGAHWLIGIERPPRADEPPGGAIETVELDDLALATSGSYRNFRHAGGKAVHHIFDPRTGRNAPSDVVSVSVRASTCALADGLATALMVLGPDGAEQVLARLRDPHLAALFVRRAPDGELTVVRVRWDP